MYMTSKKEEGVDAGHDRKHTILVTADMVLDVFNASEKEANKTKKKDLYNNAVFLSQHLNTYLPLKKSQYIIQ